MHIRRVVSFPLHAQTQQGFIVERNSFDIPGIGGPSRTLDDDQDDEVSESTEMTSAGNSKRITGITAHNHCEMRVRYDLMMKHMDSSHVRRNRPEPQRQRLKHFKTSLFCSKKKDHCQYQRNGFLQVRMAGMRRSNGKKLLKKKDGERNLDFASFSPEVQASLMGTRRIEWKS